MPGTRNQEALSPLLSLLPGLQPVNQPQNSHRLFVGRPPSVTGRKRASARARTMLAKVTILQPLP